MMISSRLRVVDPVSPLEHDEGVVERVQMPHDSFLGSVKIRRSLILKLGKSQRLAPSADVPRSGVAAETLCDVVGV